MDPKIEKEKQLEILEATEADVPAIHKVFYNAWLATYPNEEHGITVDDITYRYRDVFTPERIEKRQKIIREKTPNELYLVAKENEEVVGICFASREGEKNDLQAIYILPEYQGKGIGKKLWERALAFIDPTKETKVDLTAYNTNAIAFYEKLGFVDMGKRFTDERFRMKSGAIFPLMEMVRPADLE